MCQQFRYSELQSKGICSPMVTYCEVAGVSVETASLSTHARVDRGMKIGVANFLMFRTSELQTGFEETAAARTPVSASLDGRGAQTDES